MIDSLILQHQNQYSNLVNEILRNTKLESSKAIQMNEYTKWKFNFVKLKMKETQKKVKKNEIFVYLKHAYQPFHDEIYENHFKLKLTFDSCYSNIIKYSKSWNIKILN